MRKLIGRIIVSIPLIILLTLAYLQDPKIVLFAIAGLVFVIGTTLLGIWIGDL